ncbi:MAG: hypothetical protein HY536_00405, partial [Candidatus Colwellbacteria bacterium]|nr:hypothetical protein [Candidatus Colwellbacteria bacterium]
MPMDQAAEHFPIHDALEADIRELTPIVYRHAEKLGAGREREAVGEGLREFVAAEAAEAAGADSSSDEVSSTRPPAAPTSAILSDLPAYFADLPTDVRLEIEKLIDLAWHKGSRKAFREARSRSPHTVDAL